MRGTCNRAVVAKELTTIVIDGKQDLDVEACITQIKRKGKDADTNFDRGKAEERVDVLGGGITRVKVGTATKTELKDKKLQYRTPSTLSKAPGSSGSSPGATRA